jgi:hypothetical protein
MEMTERKAAEQVAELTERAERLMQDLAELRRRIDARPRRRQSAGSLPSSSASDFEAGPPTIPSLPARRNTPSSSDTLHWLPVLKQRSPSRSSMSASLARSASELPSLNVPSSRSPESGVRRRDPDAGRYSIIAAERSKRRANG